MRFSIILAATLVFSACSQPEATQSPTVAPATATSPMVESTATATNELSAILAAQPDAVVARYAYRHPEETLNFFGIRQGMTVVEALPGGGWYSKLLLPHLGAEGQLVGANYPYDMWPLFGFFSEERIAQLATWTTDALKPGGIAGVVQHHAPDSASDEWASGSRGYLKKSFVIAQMQAAGFEFVASSDVNSNSKDQPGAEDIVWRLPPSLRGAKDDAELTAKMLAIGESNRMTLKFRKPL